MDPNRKPAYIHYFSEREDSESAAPVNMATDATNITTSSLCASFASALLHPENSQIMPSTDTWTEAVNRRQRNKAPRHLGKEKDHDQRAENTSNSSEKEGTPHPISLSSTLRHYHYLRSQGLLTLSACLLESFTMKQPSNMSNYVSTLLQSY
jgi:hypothetical protein